ncbi:DUF2975 domain-containing protein [Nonomuraea polychroma]|uniref:DUF2975 domain-containing protein n=1 Tax=Nonomuraea polychroma TaxID=46176 RepID=UPI0030C835EF
MLPSCGYAAAGRQRSPRLAVSRVACPIYRISIDLHRESIEGERIPLLVISVLFVVTVEVVLVCVWRLVTMVRRGTVFSHAAFRYVDIVIGAIVAAALPVFALIVLVLRMLLAQAVARDIEAAQMQAELDEVI